MIRGQRQRSAAVVVGGCGGGDQRVHVVRQERGGHGGLGVEIREPAGHHLAVMVMMTVMMAMMSTAVVLLVVQRPSIAVRETRRSGSRRRGLCRVLRRDGRYGGRGTPVVVCQAQQFLDGERRPLRHRFVFGGRAHCLRITCPRKRANPSVVYG